MKTLRKTYPYLLILYGLLSLAAIAGISQRATGFNKPVSAAQIATDSLKKSVFVQESDRSAR
jgi:hypothetical protein